MVPFGCMARPSDPVSWSKTDTSPTDRADDDVTASRGCAAIAIVLESARPDAGCLVASLEGVTRVLIGRGVERRVARSGQELVIELPDRRISRFHAAVERDDGGFVLSDLGSSNGTFLGDVAVNERVTRAAVAFEQPFLVGHTVLALLRDGGPIVERARLGPPWPFTTLSARFALELAQLEQIAASSLPVLLLGETGTGKEVLARAVHERSGRSGRFVAVNCGALPANLVEAQLFGHVKGAFSGALRDEIGFVRAADHGTLFLDEIGDLPPSAQASLLRVLQEGEVTPVGAFQPLDVDVRVVSATHHPLPDRVAEGAFRADLLARLSGFSFQVPALRERRLDLGALLASFCGDGAVRELHIDATLALLAHDYPMNVRELQQAIHAAGILAADGALRRAHLPAAISRYHVVAPSAPLTAAEAALRDELAERLLASGNNLTEVARTMGKARQQVQRWVKRFGLKVR